MWENIKHGFYLNFIKENRYQWLLDGLKTTLEIQTQFNTPITN